MNINHYVNDHSGIRPESTTQRKQAHSSEQDRSTTHQVLRNTLPALVEISVNYPTIYLKNLKQQGRALPAPGMRSLRQCYRGFGASASGIMPYKTVMLTVNTVALKKLEGVRDEKQQRIIAGSMAGMAAAMVGSPFELMTVQKQIKPDLTLKDFIRLTASQPLNQGIFRGLMAMASRDIIYSALILGVSPTVKEQLPHELKGHLMGVIISAAATGIIAAAISQPLDTLKTHQQASDLKQPRPTLAKLCEGKTLKDLYRGGGFRALRISQGAAIILGTQEVIDRAFTK